MAGMCTHARTHCKKLPKVMHMNWQNFDKRVDLGDHTSLSLIQNHPSFFEKNSFSSLRLILINHQRLN